MEERQGEKKQGDETRRGGKETRREETQRRYNETRRKGDNERSQGDNINVYDNYFCFQQVEPKIHESMKSVYILYLT